MKKNDSTHLMNISRFAAILSIVEVGLGSFLHSFRVPFSGQFLSLNQGLFLTRLTKKGRPKNLEQRGGVFNTMTTSNIVAILKSLSPAGKKLTPMLAISAQGFLFNLGTLFFGMNIIGVTVGMLLLGTWAFVQPAIIYLLIFGKTLIDVFEYFYVKFSKSMNFDSTDLLHIFLILVTIKLVISILIGFLGWYLPDRKIKIYEGKMIALGKKRKLRTVKSMDKNSIGSQFVLAFKDLLNPLFLMSFAFTLLFLIFVRHSLSEVIWILLRPLAVGYILFLLIRILPLIKWFEKINSNSKFASLVKQTIEQVNRI